MCFAIATGNNCFAKQFSDHLFFCPSKDMLSFRVPFYNFPFCIYDNNGIGCSKKKIIRIGQKSFVIQVSSLKKKCANTKYQQRSKKIEYCSSAVRNRNDV